MIKILKHLGKSWAWVPVIFALLVAQAVCDLALPQYTSDIVDVGIQQGGIENAALDEISEVSFEKLLMFDKSGSLDEYYDIKNDGNRNMASEPNPEIILQSITYPAAVVYALDHMDSSILPDEVQLPEGMTITDALLAMPEEQRAPMIEEINKQFEGYSEVMLSQMAVEFAREELIAQGADMDKI